MSGNVKAIETRYKGYRFRSRLEARWAVYFDALGIKWDYEAEGFKLADGTAYLPDFWLSQVKMYAEVKPLGTFALGDQQKCSLLARQIGHPCLMLDGPPDLRSYWAAYPFREDWVQEGDRGWVTDYIVNADYISEDRFYQSTGMSWPDIERHDEWQNTSDWRAVQAARSARFEYGESGSPAVTQHRPASNELDPTDPLYATKLRIRQINKLLPLVSADDKVALTREKAALYEGSWIRSGGRS